MVIERLSRFVLHHRLAVALVWLAVLAAGVATASKVSGRLSQEFSVPSAPSYKVNQQILATYGTGGDGYPEVAVITLPTGATVDTPGIRQALGRAFALVTADPRVRLRVVSYADPNPNPNPSGGSGSDARAGSGDRRLVSADGRTTIGLIFTPHHGELQATNLAPQITTTLQRALPAGATVQVTGLDALAAGGSSGQGPGVLAETLLGGLGALAVLAFVFGSLLALVPLLIAAVAILTTFLVILGLTELTQVSFIVQFLVALIGLGVSIDYSLLLVTRWREELAHGHRGDEAVHAAMATAGRAIVFSGLTVAAGLLALVLVPVPFLRSMGYGGMLIPLVGVLVTLTLLPVLLAWVGRRLDWPRLRREASASRGWTAWARAVVRHRWLAALGALGVLAALGVAAPGIQIGEPAATSLAGSTASSSPAIDGLRALQHAGIPTGVLTPIEVLVSTGPGTGTDTGVDPAQVAARLAAVPGIHTVLAPTGAAWHRGDTALVEALPVAETSTAAGRATLTRVRDTINAAPAPRRLSVMVGGAGANLVDETHAFYSRFPLMLAAIALITFVLLARAFRSLLLPLKAVLLNLASVGATYGVLVLVWQHGHGSKLIWNIPATGAITNWVPLITFAFLYGLSMDYEVFILARMREAHDRTGSTTTAITEGIGRTGRLITSAALILFLAFASLGAGPETDIKVAATALGAGILLDATVVRGLLVPALVSLFGRWNWWLPAWAARLLRVPPSPARDQPEPEPNFASALTRSDRAQPTQPR
jgi:putative drug exporter of the RND superfamily